MMDGALDSLSEIPDTSRMPPSLDATFADAPASVTTDVLFGGTSSSSDLEIDMALNDTWTFDGMSWTAVTTVTTTNAQPVRLDSSMATLAGQIVLFGGSATGGYMCDCLSDTWTFNGVDWTPLGNATNSPPGRYGASMATLGNQIVLFGGNNGYTDLNDTWTFDGMAWAPAGIATAPPARSYASMATLGDELVLFGGSADLNDTWTYKAGVWTRISVSNSPPGRERASMATLGNNVVLFGGENVESYSLLGDTWMFDGTSWTTPTGLAPAPSARYWTSMASVDNQVVLFGGYGYSSGPNDPPLSETWLFNGVAWTQVGVSSPSLARAGASMAPFQ
jgi:hypothetical protein